MYLLVTQSVKLQYSEIGKIIIEILSSVFIILYTYNYLYDIFIMYLHKIMYPTEQAFKRAIKF